MKMSMVHQLFVSTACCFLLFLLLVSDFCHFVGAQGIGVTIARECKTVPTPEEIIALCLKINAKRVRLYNAYKDRNLLEAFQAETEKFEVTVGVSNDDVMSIVRGNNSAVDWLTNNIMPFVNGVSFRCIVVGGTLTRVDSEYANSVYQALVQLLKAQASMDLMIPMGIEVDHGLLVPNQTLYPSDGEFAGGLVPVLQSIFEVLLINKGVLIVDLYPMTRYYEDSYYQNLQQQFLWMGETDDATISDNGVTYHNIYESGIEMFYWAMEKVGAKGIHVILGETGWPTDGQSQLAHSGYAATYTNNLVDWLNNNKGTPRRSWPTETFIRTLYVQDKSGSGGDGYGLFFTNGTSANPFIKITHF